MSVNHSIKGESISPARGEVQNIDLTVRSGGLPNPAQQYLLTVGLLQIWHDVLHDILHLQDSNNNTLQTYDQFSSWQNQITSQIMEGASPRKSMNQTPIPHIKFDNSSLQVIFALYWLQEPVMLRVIITHYSCIMILPLSLVRSALSIGNHTPHCLLLWFLQ